MRADLGRCRFRAPGPPPRMGCLPRSPPDRGRARGHPAVPDGPLGTPPHRHRRPSWPSAASTWSCSAGQRHRHRGGPVHLPRAGRDDECWPTSSARAPKKAWPPAGSAAASPGSLPGRPRWPGACTPRPAATGSAAIPSTRSPAPSQSPARPSTGTLTRTTPSDNRTRARGRARHRPGDTGATSPAITPAAAGTAVARARAQRQRSGLTPAALACPACGHQPASRPEALRQREDLAIVWLHQDSPSGPISQHRHCASCQPHVECGTVECAHRGDGPVRTGALVDQLRKHDPNQPTALRAWLTSHGWQLEPEPLCPAHSNSIKD